MKRKFILKTEIRRKKMGKKSKKLKEEVRSLKRELTIHKDRMRTGMGSLTFAIGNLNTAIKALYQPFPSRDKENRAISQSSQEEESQAPHLKIVSADKQ